MGIVAIMFATLLPHIKKHKKAIFLAFFTVFLQQVFSLIDPQIFRVMVDDYLSKYATMAWNDFMYGVLWLLLLSMAVALVARISKHMQNYYVSVVSQKVGAGVYTDSIKHSLALPYAVFEDERSGELLEKFQKARQDLQQFIM